MRRNFLFGRTLTIAPHRLVDLASPSIDAAVEVDCVVKACVSKKVDDHLTASAVMANDYQWFFRREVVGARWNFRHRNMQSAFPALRMSASSRTEIASDPLRASVGIARLFPWLICYTTALHMPDWKPVK